MRKSFLLVLVLVGCDSIGAEKNRPPPVDSGDDSAASLTFTPSVVDFGDVSYGDLYQEAVTISNLGGEDIVISQITAVAPFTVSPSSLTLGGGRSSTIIVYLQPTSYEDFSTELTLVTDADAVGTVTLPVSATTITDEDGDGFDVLAAGGDDCDDEDADVNPDAAEAWYDGVDQNCDNLSDYDQDGDGYEGETDDHQPDEVDCIDTNPAVNPGVTDTPYDGIDSDCSGVSDWDQDGDGYGSLAHNQGSDCDDLDADINIGEEEAFNGADDDCDGESDIGAEAELSPYIYDSDGSSDRAGYSVAMGDLDGDGDAELIVGAPYATQSGQQRGGVAIFEGGELLASGTAIDDADNWYNHDNQGAQLGSFVTVMGDFDGDLVNDLAVGAPGLSSNSGAVYLISGADALRRDLDYAMMTVTGNSSSSLGRGLGTDIDLDADGMSELVMMYASGSSNYVGIEYGNAVPASTTIDSLDARYSTDGAEAAFYRNAPVGGDFDGDGYADLVLSDGKADYGSTSDSGAIWILWGKSTAHSTPSVVDIESQATTVNYGSASSSYNGWATQMGEDWDRDGDDELWIFDAGDNALYVVEGGSTRKNATFDASTAAAVTYTWGSSSPDAEMIRRVGDFTGDGVDEMMVFLEDASGVYGLSEMFSSEVQSGTFDEGDAMIGELVGSTDYGNGNVGYGMAPVGGDVDGDGDDDFAVGDPEYDSNAGQAYVLINKLIGE